ncbi:phospholipase D family protein [Roseicella aerolata]|uniref:Phospholipase D family protein n=1 Tax=Roseicella aerolata TaxID=2883479 RepID=A0A9X1IIV7_9PROT|nr:phospholipase D family protein [Roseicella aerolata]MCB4825447.1 phospholipase D family protein [Roseicella aerolata]
MKFLTRPDLDEAIRDVLLGKRVRCAVAFWGRGADELFSRSAHPEREVKIVCNLKSGGTNPAVIRKLVKQGALVRQRGDLHAKVYVSDRGAVVTSANASANGMGLESSEAIGWLEAGVVIPDPSAPAAWFEQIWPTCHEITPSDLKVAQAAWQRRQRAKPTLKSFAEFDTEAAELPLIDWYSSDADWKTDKASVREQIGVYDDAVEDAISDGLDLPPGDEGACFRHGRWVLRWRRIGGKKIGKRTGLYWTCLDRVVKQAFRYRLDDGKLGPSLDVALALSNPPPQPFDVRDPLFQQAFAETIMSEAFERLRDDFDEQVAWQAPRQEITRAFWQATKARYLVLVSGIASPRKPAPG